MSGQDLYTCNGKKATTTARNIMRFKYPKVSTNFKFSSIDKSIPDAILSNETLVCLFLVKIFFT
jgi:hypothetical protein